MNSSEKTRAFFIFSFGIAVSVLALSGCAPGYTPLSKKKNSIYTQAQTDGEDDVNQAPATGEEAKLAEPPQVKINGIGYTSYTFTVKARKVLKVDFTPGVQEKTKSNGQDAFYSMLGVFIKAGTITASRPTEMLNNGFLTGSSAQRSSVIDLSAGIPSGCSDTDTSCRVDVTITVEKPNNDYECMVAGYMACPWSRVPAGIPWNGTLRIQTDDTQVLN